MFGVAGVGIAEFDGVRVDLRSDERWRKTSAPPLSRSSFQRESRRALGATLLPRRDRGLKLDDSENDRGLTTKIDAHAGSV